MALALRLLFGFDVNVPLTLLVGGAGRMMMAAMGAGVNAPDWWHAEVVVTAATTLAILGCLQVARGHRY